MSGVMDKNVIVVIIDEDESRLNKSTVTLCGQGLKISEDVVSTEEIEIGPGTEMSIKFLLGFAVFSVDQEVLNNKDDLSIFVSCNGEKSSPVKICLPLQC